jgi:hypothetical protein
LQEHYKKDIKEEKRNEILKLFEDKKFKLITKVNLASACRKFISRYLTSSRKDDDFNDKNDLSDQLSRYEFWSKEIFEKEDDLNKELNYLKEKKITVGQCFGLYNLMGCDEKDELKDIIINIQINKIPLTVNDFRPANDESWLKANEKLKELNRSINEANMASTANVQSAINDYKIANAKMQEHLSEIERKKLICEINQKNLNNEETKRMASTADLTKYEKLKLILKDFILAKLAMINESRKQIFPDIEFTLVEQNITEGSFDEVCYPLIVGKKTPFANGSNSERILTGIHIINDLHRFLGIQPLPIIFDEGETLDDFSVSEIVTDNQVIYSKVDSRFAIDYPTAI